MNKNTTEIRPHDEQTVRIRDKGIDFLMFIAVMLVVNSHLDMMYVGRFKFLATGGILGDALFFFCSGYKLFLGNLGRFDDWYKRRVIRIYPSIIIWDISAALIFSLPLSVSNIFDGWQPGGYWFVKCIMFHYIGIYFIRKYMINHLMWIIFAVCAGVLIWWVIAYSTEFADAMFSAPKFQWYYMFIFSLMDAFLGRSTHVKFKYWMSTIFPLFLICYYGFLKCVDLFPVITPIKVMAILPMIGVIYGLYLISRCNAIETMMNNYVVGGFLSFIGGLCLEVYISHTFLVTDAYNHFFPLNIAVFLMSVFLLAYIIRCVTKFVVQTFSKDKAYDYSSIFR